MKFPLKEPVTPRYLYINPRTNVVHLLMPIMSGTEIGLDNTCKAVYSLQEFFGLMGAAEQRDALGELTRYEEALEFDIKYMPDSKEKKDKIDRLKQIIIYKDLLSEVQQDERVINPLKHRYPTYPAPLESLMQTQGANLYSMILRPGEEDVHLRTTAINPVFSANRSQLVNGQVIYKTSLLYDILSDSFQALRLTPKSKEQLIARVVAHCASPIVDFEQIRTGLTQEVNRCFGIHVDFKNTQGKRATPSVPMNQAYLDEQMGINADNRATKQLYANSLIEYCAPNLFDTIADSPFYAVENSDQLCIITQFFLAELNILCYEKGLTQANFGQILENNPDLIINLAETVKKALRQHHSVEDTLFAFVTDHHQAFQIKGPIPQEIKERFKIHYEHIKRSPYFDEFMVLSDKKGFFVSHQGCIATPFVYFLQTGFYYGFSPSAKDLFFRVQHDFEMLERPQNTIPHKNEHLQAELELDLTKMDNGRLQALYEELNTYPDPKLKKELLSQFQQELPDFKPQINAKEFLQHVAYGEQDQAEQLLKKNPGLAQELLRASNIPFTDYSGRTFTCTAYEYAFWAKDSHMQRMLEKYILQNEDTRQLILNKVLLIEGLVSPASSPSSSSSFFLPLPSTPQGLHYRDKHGRLITGEAHFDFTPLINALNEYVAAYNKSPKRTEADWKKLDKIWIEKVGRAQREVPAHIAQEYCHPNRTFEDVANDETLLHAAWPDNLRRQLKFYNSETGTNDYWFTRDSYRSDTGLGFLFAVLRSGGPLWGGVGGSGTHARPSGRAAARDARALIAIDNVRTNEIKHSFEFLGPSAITYSQPAGPGY